MTGLSTLLFTLGLVLVMALVYMTGMVGWMIGSCLLIGGWVAIVVLKAADPGVIAVQALVSAVTMGLALRWVFRNTHWRQRVSKEKQETEEKQRQIRSEV